MAVDFKKKAAEARATIDEKVCAFNEALKKNDIAAATIIEGELKDAEKDYAAMKQTEVFADLAKTPNPVLAAIEMHHFPVIGHRVLREEGSITGIELVEDKPYQINLVKLCEACKLPTDWKYKVEKFNQLLALRAATELKFTKAQIQQVCDSYYISDLAKKVEMGETPTSNTAICKQLQQVLDAILFVPDEKGKNKYRANNHDVAYLLMCHTKRSSKKELGVNVAKVSYAHRLVLDVYHRIATGKTYTLDYRMAKPKEDKKPATKKVSTKAEKAKVPETVVPRQQKAA